MFNFIKKVIKNFKKDEDSISDISEFDAEAFSRMEKEDRIIFLTHFSKEKKEYDLRSFHDESDALITSLASFVLSLGGLVISNVFEIPSMLFLATAVFASYFSVVSLFKTGSFKTGFMVLIFPFTMIATTALIQYDADINDINNGLSLIALGVSLMIISPQKRKERRQLKINKLKNDMLLNQDEMIREREKQIKELKDSNEKLQQNLDKANVVLREIESMKNDLDDYLNKNNS